MALRSPLINVMAGAAKKAARGLLRDFGEVEQLQVSLKGPSDFVSAADRRAEEVIRAELTKARPTFGFLMEEQGVVVGTDTSNRWLVDPLDGTTNFLHGFPQYCVSIALRHKGVLQQGVIFDPTRNELFTATRGAGAYLNDRRIRVSATDEVDGALFSTGFPFRELADFPAYLRGFERVMRVSAGVRRPGAAALDLAWVAAGRTDGFWESGLSAWDMAAGALLVREAGGIVSGYVSGEDFLESGRIVAAAPKVHEALLGLVTQA